MRGVRGKGQLSIRMGKNERIRVKGKIRNKEKLDAVLGQAER